jgi:hypothetical protein
MGSTLFNTTPQNTYPSLIKLADNLPLSATLKTLSDGLGNDSVLALSTNSLQIGGTTGATWDDTNKRLGIGTNAPSGSLEIVDDNTNQIILGVKTSQSASTFLIYNSNSQTTPVWNIGNGNPDTRIGFYNTLTFRANGTTIAEMGSSEVSVGGATGARLGIKGSGSTSATTSLLVQNSAGSTAVQVGDDGLVAVAKLNSLGFLGVATTLYISTNSNIKANGSGIIQLGDAPETGFNRLQFGGNTSSFPSIKRNGSAIDIRLADDSNYALLNTGATFIKGSGSTSATTSLLVQNSSGDTAFQIKDDREITTSGGNVSLRDGALFIGSNFLSTYTHSIGFFGAPVSSAIVEMQSTTKGFLPPRMTTTQKNAITAATGLVLYDTTTNKLQCWNGSTWNDLF